eukprot:2135503-Lingulodinium_polyedra.AAC.1
MLHFTKVHSFVILSKLLMRSRLMLSFDGTNMLGGFGVGGSKTTTSSSSFFSFFSSVLLRPSAGTAARSISRRCSPSGIPVDAVVVIASGASASDGAE